MNAPPTPHYKDSCGHGAACFRGTCVETLNGKSVDVYVFTDAGSPNVCLRFGDDAEDYYSPCLPVIGLDRLREVYGQEVAALVSGDLGVLYEQS